MRAFRLLCLLLATALALAGCRHRGSDSDTLTPEQEERAATVIDWRAAISGWVAETARSVILSNSPVIAPRANRGLRMMPGQ